MSDNPFSHHQPGPGAKDKIPGADYRSIQSTLDFPALQVLLQGHSAGTTLGFSRDLMPPPGRIAQFREQRGYGFFR